MGKLINRIKNYFKKDYIEDIEEEVNTEYKCNTCSNNIEDEKCLKGQHMPKIFCNHYNKKLK